MKINQLKIGQRLGTAFGAVVLLLLLTAVVAGSRLLELRDSGAALSQLQGKAHQVNNLRGDIELNLNLTLALVAPAATAPQTSAVAPRLIANAVRLCQDSGDVYSICNSFTKPGKVLAGRMRRDNGDG